MVPSTFLLAEEAKAQEVHLVSWRRPQQQGEDVNLAVLPDAEMTASGGCTSVFLPRPQMTDSARVTVTEFIFKGTMADLQAWSPTVSAT